MGLTGSSKAQHTAPRQGRDETFLMSVSENKNREVGMVLMSQRSATILVKQDALFSSLFLCTRHSVTLLPGSLLNRFSASAAVAIQRQQSVFDAAPSPRYIHPAGDYHSAHHGGLFAAPSAASFGPWFHQPCEAAPLQRQQGARASSKVGNCGDVLRCQEVSGLVLLLGYVSFITS